MDEPTRQKLLRMGYQATGYRNLLLYGALACAVAALGMQFTDWGTRQVSTRLWWILTGVYIALWFVVGRLHELLKEDLDE